MYCPKAKRERLVVQEVGEELVVYNLINDESHSLTRIAALVWQQCDGNNSVEDILRLVATEMSEPCDGDTIEAALESLGNAGLLEETGDTSVAVGGLSRRRFLQSASAAVALTSMVTTLTISPKAAHANQVSCGVLSSGQGCGNGYCVGGGSCHNPAPPTIGQAVCSC